MGDLSDSDVLFHRKKLSTVPVLPVAMVDRLLSSSTAFLVCTIFIGFMVGQFSTETMWCHFHLVLT